MDPSQPPIPPPYPQQGPPTGKPPQYPTPPQGQYGFDDGDDEGISIDFGRIFETLKKYFWLILLFIAAGVIGAVAYLNVATPIFQSFALLRVEQRVQDATPVMAMRDGTEDLRSIEMLKTIEQSFLSRTLMQRVASRLKLAERPEFLGAGVPEIDRTEMACVGMLMGNTQAIAVRGTRLIRISFDHPEPEIAREIVDALIREHSAQDSESRLDSASGNIAYLMAEREQIERKLRESEGKLMEYAQELGSISVDSEMNIIAEQLQQLNSRLTVAKADRLKLESDFEQIEEVREEPKSLLQIGSIAQLPEIQALRQQLTTMDGELSKLLQRYGDDHPQVTGLLSQRATLEEALYAEALRAPRMVELSLRAAVQNEKSLERETAAQEKKTLGVKEVSIQSKVLERQIEADKMAFQAVLARLNQETSEARSQPIFLQVVDAASPPYQVRPRPLIVVAIALMAALGLSGATIFLLANLDTSIKSVDEVEGLVGLPVLSSVPESLELTKASNKKKKQKRGEEISERWEGLVLLEDKYSTTSEAFRTLRASFALLADEARALLITSAVPGEGKSFCAANLAVALAQQETRTILIDADLRKPTVEARLFGPGDHQPGLGDYLLGRADLDEIIRPTDIPNLHVITAGRDLPNPAELLARKSRVQLLLDGLDKRFERLVMDSAPILAVSDTLSLAQHFSSVGLVVRSHKTPRRMVKRAVELLARTGHPAHGTILNLVPSKASAGDYYYYSYSAKGGRSVSYGSPEHISASEGAR